MILVKIVDYHHLLIDISVPPLCVSFLDIGIRITLMGGSGLTGTGRSIPPFIIQLIEYLRLLNTVLSYFLIEEWYRKRISDGISSNLPSFAAFSASSHLSLFFLPFSLCDNGLTPNSSKSPSFFAIVHCLVYCPFAGLKMCPWHHLLHSLKRLVTLKMHISL